MNSIKQNSSPVLKIHIVKNITVLLAAVVSSKFVLASREKGVILTLTGRLKCGSMDYTFQYPLAAGLYEWKIGNNEPLATKEDFKKLITPVKVPYLGKEEPFPDDICDIISQFCDPLFASGTLEIKTAP